MSGRLIIENRAAAPAPDGSGVTKTWDEAAALIAEATAAGFEAVARERAEERASMLRQIEDLASLVRTLTDRRAEDVAAISAHAERADGLARQVAHADGVIARVIVDLQTERERADGLARQVADLQAASSAAAARTVETDLQTAQAIEDARSVAATLVKGVHDRLAEQAGELAGFVHRVVSLEDSRRADGEAVARGFVGVNERVDELHQAASEIADEVRDAVAAAAGAVDQVARISARAGDLLNQVPAGWMIDRAGELVRISAAGETVSLGPVVGRDGADGTPGRDGADGRDGAAAPQIIAAAIEGNRLRLIQSDGIEHGCELPLPAVAAATPTVEPGPDVDDMRKMRAKGDTLAVIGKKHNISGSYVSRLIKKAEQNDGK